MIEKFYLVGGSGGEKRIPSTFSGAQRSRGRRYRSEADIIRNILEVLHFAGDEGAKKTRIMQLANLNNNSFSRYMELLVREGLVKVQGGVYRLTPKGRLVLHLLDVYFSLIDPGLDAREYETLMSTLNSAVETAGMKLLEASTGIYDAIVDHGKRVGVIIMGMCDSSCMKLAVSLARGLMGMGDYRVDKVLIVAVLREDGWSPGHFKASEEVYVATVPRRMESDVVSALAETLRSIASDE